MSGLCGWFDPGGRGPANANIDTMAATLTQFDGSPVRTNSTEWGAVATAARRANGDVFQDGDRLVAVHGRTRFSDARLEDLAQRQGTACALAEGYVQKGTEVLKLLAGSFALAVLDRLTGRALLAIDRMGACSLCYTTEGEKLIFASTLDAISAFPGSNGEIRQQAIYDYLHFHIVPAPQTLYVHRERLLPGTFMTWNNGTSQTAPYWEMRFIEDEKRPFPDLKKEFLALVRKGVEDAAQEGSTGTFLSGGTDSSTVAGMLRDVTGEAPRTYSIGFDAQGFDEVSYARIAAGHFKTRHKEYYVTPDDVVSAIPSIAAIHDQPFGNSSAVPTYYCAKLARGDGVDTLLGGDGGDELFGGNARYATQYLYSLYSDLPRSIRKSVIDPMVSLLPQAGIAGKMRRYVASASMPMPARYDRYNLLEHLGPTNVLTSDFLDTVSQTAPAVQMDQAYRATNAHSLINRMLALDVKYTLADNDLPKVVRSCELAGVEVRFPLLSDELVAFSARLPPDLKLRGTRLRYFFKKALQDFLPHEIITKTKHGFGMPFGRWLELHKRTRDLALDSLSDLKSRHIVRPDFIDQLSAVHVKNHVDYYGTMVWILMMLEQWLKRHRVYL